MDLKKGDRVMITYGPIEKVGRMGTVTLMMENGAFVKIDDTSVFTPVQFEHLEKVEGS